MADKQQTNKDNTYNYHINTNHAIGVLKDRFIKALLESIDDKGNGNQEVIKILYLLANSVSIVRSGRSVERKSSSRNAKFHHNKKSNA